MSVSRCPSCGGSVSKPPQPQCAEPHQHGVSMAKELLYESYRQQGILRGNEKSLPFGAGSFEEAALRAIEKALQHREDLIGRLVGCLSGVRWKSADRDNMEFTATITYSQMDAIREALASRTDSIDSGGGEG